MNEWASDGDEDWDAALELDNQRLAKLYNEKLAKRNKKVTEVHDRSSSSSCPSHTPELVPSSPIVPPYSSPVHAGSALPSSAPSFGNDREALVKEWTRINEIEGEDKVSMTTTTRKVNLAV